MTACDACLRRTAAVAAVAAQLDVEWRRRSAPSGVLSLPDEALLGLDATGAAARGYARFSAGAARAGVQRAGLHAICRCDPAYPGPLRELADPPAVLHVAGRVAALAAPESVAVVGARRGTAYGLEVARGLGRGLSAAGVPVVSGMAIGIDSAAHVGVLEHAPDAASGAVRSAAPVAVLAGGRGRAVSVLPRAVVRAARAARVRGVRAAAGLRGLPVVLRGAQPDHRRPRDADRGRRGGRASGSLTTADFAAAGRAAGRARCRDR